MSVEPLDTGIVAGHLHLPEDSPRGAVALTHGAGGNCDARILQLMCSRFADAGFLALRYDLPFRRRKPKGPPQPSRAAEDREGVAAAAAELRERVSGPLLLGGVSYGGRQTSMLAADEPDIADALVLLSYPLHPPGKPERARTEHLPEITVPTVFVHGDRDPFGSPDEMRQALTLVSGATTFVEVTGAAHDLSRAKSDPSESAVPAALHLLAVKS
ncbi:dienelactone hydrolase family protein [Rhodococcus sp. Z13]|uniref:Dienelactone hydrolase family protein n=1 Tax=Rhodococcus sacchari TaxID=2962047 RepID=A0ACD4DIC6_9NOCA|nr:alpha/beta family hydrolase [Rhodococcus sp. Z13]UYP19793.1 dienelactone hydrolase family protein [Rhodococcus sp. Z13]